MRTRSDIEREIEKEAGVYAVVQERDGDLVITAEVESEGEKEAAIDVATEMAPDKRIVDDIEIVAVLPETVEGMHLSEAAVGDFPGATPGTTDDESLEPGDFADQDILTNPMGASGPGYTAADEEISEGEDTYVPPTDPVRRPDGEFLNGFETTSMDSVHVARSASDGEIGDESISHAVREELRQDAATTDLNVRVRVENGVVFLRGKVPSLDDAENAEEVASRIPGVTDVMDELEIADLA
jgi:hyperosmotically inducible protein